MDSIGNRRIGMYTRHEVSLVFQARTHCKSYNEAKAELQGAVMAILVRMAIRAHYCCIQLVGSESVPRNRKPLS